MIAAPASFSFETYLGRPSTSAGIVSAGPRLLLQLEGLLTLAAAVAGYRALGGEWGWFFALLLLPDLSMLGYLAGPRVGALAYNAAHALVGPALLAGLALAWGPGEPRTTALLASLIWVAHVGMDRAAGYGLKYGSSFFDTHLSQVGSQSAGSAAAPG